MDWIIYKDSVCSATMKKTMIMRKISGKSTKGELSNAKGRVGGTFKSFIK